MQKNIGDIYEGMDLTCDTHPSDETVNLKAYLDAISTFKAGDVAVFWERICWSSIPSWSYLTTPTV